MPRAAYKEPTTNDVAIPGDTVVVNMRTPKQGEKESSQELERRLETIGKTFIEVVTKLKFEFEEEKAGMRSAFKEEREALGEAFKQELKNLKDNNATMLANVVQQASVELHAKFTADFTKEMARQMVAQPSGKNKDPRVKDLKDMGNYVNTENKR